MIAFIDCKTAMVAVSTFHDNATVLEDLPINDQIMAVYQAHSRGAEQDDHITNLIGVSRSSLPSFILSPMPSFQQATSILGECRFTNFSRKKTRRDRVDADIVTAGFKSGLKTSMEKRLRSC